MYFGEKSPEKVEILVSNGTYGPKTVPKDKNRLTTSTIARNLKFDTYVVPSQK